LGWSGIPQPWSERIVARERIAAIAGRLHDATTCAGPEEPWLHDEFVHGWWIEPGVVLAGEYPGHRDSDRAASKVDLLVDQAPMPGGLVFIVRMSVR